MTEPRTKEQVERIKEKIKSFSLQMVKAILIDKPKDVGRYMLEWLQKYGGYTSTGLTLEEKKELEQLRLEIKKYREMDEHKNKNENDSDSQSDDNAEDDIDPKLDNVEYTKKKMSVVPRSAVSAEVYGNYNKKENFVGRKIPKTEEQIQKIKTRILHSFLFGSLDSKDLDIVIEAMEEKKFKKDDYVIKQGDDGDCLFIVEEGKLDCFRKNKEGVEKKIKEYSEGDVFGELALLYNAPRAASLKCTDDVTTWCLDRETFNHIVKDAAQKKREHYEGILKKVEILSTMEPYELMQICDALKSITYKKGDYIIKEGEMGDIFYILEAGECDATKTLEPGKGETVIKEYKEGDYFGERALIKGEPRYANVVAKSDFVKVICLDRDSCKRLLGPITELLKRNMEKYQNFVVASPTQ